MSPCVCRCSPWGRQFWFKLSPGCVLWVTILDILGPQLGSLGTLGWFHCAHMSFLEDPRSGPWSDPWVDQVQYLVPPGLVCLVQNLVPCGPQVRSLGSSGLVPCATNSSPWSFQVKSGGSLGPLLGVPRAGLWGHFVGSIGSSFWVLKSPVLCVLRFDSLNPVSAP